MTRLLHLDTFSGISGDMLLGALIDAGLEFEALRSGLEALQLDGYKLICEKVFRGPFHATDLSVLLDGPPLPPPSQDDGADQDGHSHSHGHGHSHSHEHVHHHDGSNASPGPQRNLRDISTILKRSALSESVRERALSVFERIGHAEAKAHGVTLDAVHFHEVGAVDSIVDIVGGCLALELLKVDRVSSTPPVLGTGFTQGAHGTFPLPAPATVELLRGIPVCQRNTPFELTTPTGAALVATFAEKFGTLPPMSISSIGYGAGNDRPTEIPNILRVFLGTAVDSPLDAGRDRVVLLETNIDDMSPQWIGHLIERLFEKGALDVTVAPVLMKKSRSAHTVSVLAKPGTEAPLEELLFHEGTTFGLRKQEVDRLVLERRFVKVATEWGEVRVKIGERAGKVASAQPEYDDLRRLAATSGLPLRELHRRVLEAFHRQ